MTATKGKGYLFRKVAFRAYFADGRDIGQIAVLEGIAEEIGFNRNRVRNVREKGLPNKEADAGWTRTWQLDIMSEPFYLYGDEQLA